MLRRTKDEVAFALPAKMRSKVRPLRGAWGWRRWLLAAGCWLLAAAQRRTCWVPCTSFLPP
jgi:hypothetical protein